MKRPSSASDPQKRVKLVLNEDNKLRKVKVVNIPINADSDGLSLLSVLARDGYIDEVKSILADEQFDLSANDNYAIRWACANGRTELVKLLLEDERVDPSAEYNEAIQKAAKNGHYDVVKLLLADKRVDPCAERTKAVQLAHRIGHRNVVVLLLSDERVYSAILDRALDYFWNR